jgi:hypothetical protein
MQKGQEKQHLALNHQTTRKVETPMRLLGLKSRFGIAVCAYRVSHGSQSGKPSGRWLAGGVFVVASLARRQALDAAPRPWWKRDFETM